MKGTAINGNWYRKELRLEHAGRNIRDACIKAVHQKFEDLQQYEPGSAYVLLRWGPISDMLNRLLDECRKRRKPVRSVYFDYNQDTKTGVRYCDAKIEQCYNSGYLQQILLIRADYIHNVHIQFQQDTNKIPASQYFENGKTPLTQHELYELVSKLIPRYISEEKMLKELKNKTKYTPILFADQIEPFHKQEQQFKVDLLMDLEPALPALQDYLKILLNPAELKARKGKIKESEKTIQKMEAAFKQCSNTLNFKVKSITEVNYPLISFIASHWQTLMNQPMIIFQLWRHPVSRSWDETHSYSFKTLLQKAYCEAVPITPYTLKTDGIFFSEIVELCKEYCSKEGKDFDAESWKAYWRLVELITEALTFSPTNMLYELELLHDWRLRNSYNQAFTMTFIEQDAQGALLRLLKPMNNKNLPFGKEITNGLNAVDYYRNLFELPGTTSDMVKPLLEAVSESFGWNYFNNYMKESYNNPIDQKRFKCSIVEWILLQHFCEKAKNEILALLLILWKPEDQAIFLA